MPLFPPTVNHYKKPFVAQRGPRAGKQSFLTTAEAQAFKDAIAIFARGATLVPSDPRERERVRYGLYVTVVFGPGDRGDFDNFWKCLADGLKDAGVIHSDAKVIVGHIELEQEARELGPKTEIMVTLENPRRRRIDGVH